MAPPEIRIISIGTLPAHPLWEEGHDVRTGHATSSLIVAGDATILVDPGLPPAVLDARLSERTPIRPDRVTHVFVTTFTEDHYRGLALFEQATWHIHEPELACAGAALGGQREHALDGGDGEIVTAIDRHLELLERCTPAPDRLAPGVDLFPLPGLSPGTCGLLVSRPTTSILVCGDAVPTAEHLLEGKVLPTCVDVELAQASFREALEIADVLVLGRDNLAVNPIRPII